MRGMWRGFWVGRLLAGALALATLGVNAGAAVAQCANFNALTVSVGGVPTVNYDPFVAGAATVSFNVTFTNSAATPCRAAVWFQRPAGVPARMTSGTHELQYSIHRPDGNLIIVSTGGLPGQNSRFTRNVNGNSSQTAIFELRIPPGQVLAAGSYQDLVIDMVVGGLQANGGPLITPIRTVTSFADPSATVISKCILPTPTTPNLSFAPGDIPNGRPNEGVVKTTSFTNVQCTAPTKLRLTGGALLPTAVTQSRAGFDNFINWRAQGTFGAANSTLQTAGATSLSVDSAQKNVASGATSNGQINISVNLINGQPVIAGTYSGTLTVSIDPSF